MSLSPDDTASNLYCGESASEVVSSDAAGACRCILGKAYELPNDDESSIVHMFDSELEQMPGHELRRGLLNRDEIVTARLDAINWMLKVHDYHNFRHETAYLSVNYLDRFLCSRALPEGKRWPWQLLSVACLSLAAKLEETRVPLLLDLQVLEPKFMFTPKTVQRMELLVMANLRWRLRVITPLDFVDYFIAKLQCPSTQVDDNLCGDFSGVWDLILSSCRAIDFLDHTPSTIAAAAVLCATRQKVNDKTVVFHERVSKELVKRCCRLFKEHLVIKKFQPACNKQKILKSIPPSPVGMLEAASGKTRNARKYLARTPSRAETQLPKQAVKLASRDL